MTNIVSRDTFTESTEETKLLLIYDMLTRLNATLEEHVETQTAICERRVGLADMRLKKLERRKLLHGGLAAGGGVFGGIIAILIKIKILDQ